MKTRYILLVLLSPLVIVSQKHPDKYKSKGGVVYSVGDTITLNSPSLPDRYASVMKGRGISLVILTDKDSEKLIIRKIVNTPLYGSEYGRLICKDFSGGTYTVFYEAAEATCEISPCIEDVVILQEPREIPENFKPFSFQGLGWGSNANEIENTIKGLSYLNEKYTKNDKIVGINALLVVRLEDNHISYMGYVFNEKHSNDNLYVEDYLTIKKLLVQKYGKPKKDENYWRDDLYKNKYDKWGFAISIGDMVMESKWELPDTDIMLKLSGDNYKVSHILRYDAYPKHTAVNNKKEDLGKL
ncbi:MAG: hypothetical protein AAF348_17925 [Bacteroidota bacterium]